MASHIEDSQADDSDYNLEDEAARSSLVCKRTSRPRRNDESDPGYLAPLMTDPAKKEFDVEKGTDRFFVTDPRVPDRDMLKVDADKAAAATSVKADASKALELGWPSGAREARQFFE